MLKVPKAKEKILTHSHLSPLGLGFGKGLIRVWSEEREAPFLHEKPLSFPKPLSIGS